MARKVLFKASFLKTFDSLCQDKKPLVIHVIEAVQGQPIHGFAPPGLGIKKLHVKGKARLFEGRAGMDLRVLWIIENDNLVFVQVGNHEDVQKFIKNL